MTTQTLIQFNQIKVGDRILTNGSYFSYSYSNTSYVCGTVSCIHPTYICLKNYGGYDLPQFPNLSEKLDGNGNNGLGCNKAWWASNNTNINTNFYIIKVEEDILTYNGTLSETLTGTLTGESYISILNKESTNKPTNKITKTMNTLTNKIKRFFDKKQQTLYKAGYITDCFDLTTEGQAELNAIVREEFMTKLLKSAEEKIKEEKKENK